MKIDFSASVRNMDPIETHYNGYWFRSRLEARWAVFFDDLDLAWTYEVQGFRLTDNLNYLPDFFIRNIKTPWGNYYAGWVEVKGVMKKKDEEKCRELAIQSELPVIMVQGDPLNYRATLYRKHTPIQRTYFSVPNQSNMIEIQKTEPQKERLLRQAGRKARSKRFES